MEEKKSDSLLVLIDAHAMIHRAFHAVPESLTSSKGEPVNATYGFIAMLLHTLAETQTEYIAIGYGTPSPTFRHLDFAAYKAHRPSTADALRLQIERIREVITAWGIPLYDCDGYEADDVLGTLAKQ